VNISETISTFGVTTILTLLSVQKVLCPALACVLIRVSANQSTLLTLGEVTFIPPDRSALTDWALINVGLLGIALLFMFCNL